MEWRVTNCRFRLSSWEMWCIKSYNELYFSETVLHVYYQISFLPERENIGSIRYIDKAGSRLKPDPKLPS